jgi:hypothetical protein
VSDEVASIDAAVTFFDVAVGPAVILIAKKVTCHWFNVKDLVTKVKPLAGIISVQTAAVLPPVEHIKCLCTAL